ncbi:hypothetical protein AOQ84DRAFT_367266 [Glonium stellatum]|uniref:RING-type domain-containing protein n=1 Tax=Glonium stellatum TaxID=574774 RepID=A0A8E2JPW5_9PEZI|nr:hypothetical protein AOQ84DRAFT_367266 [Glonium stellatum]
MSLQNRNAIPECERKWSEELMNNFRVEPLLRDPECFICKRVYNTTDDNDEVPENPIRLYPCGHVVGEHCWARYMKPYPDDIARGVRFRTLCPYCLQQLTRSKPKSILESVASFLDSIEWFFAPAMELGQIPLLDAGLVVSKCILKVLLMWCLSAATYLALRSKLNSEALLEVVILLPKIGAGKTIGLEVEVGIGVEAGAEAAVEEEAEARAEAHRGEGTHGYP